MKKVLTRITTITALFGSLTMAGCATGPARLDMTDDSDLRTTEESLKTIPPLPEEAAQPQKPTFAAVDPTTRPGCSTGAGMVSLMVGGGCGLKR